MIAWCPGKEWADLWSSVKDGNNKVAGGGDNGGGGDHLLVNGVVGSWGADTKEGLLWGTVPPPSPLHHNHFGGLGMAGSSPLLSANGNHSEQGMLFNIYVYFKNFN